MNFLGIYPENKKILIVGAYPPPLGGVSVHIKRMVQLLRKNGFEVEAIDIAKKQKTKLIRFLKLFQTICFDGYDIVHIHGFSMKRDSFIFLLKYLRKFKIYYTDHNPRLCEGQNKIKLNFIRQFIENLDFLIVVGEHILETYKRHYIKLPKNVLIKNAFLPPPMEEENRIIQTYSFETKEFLKNHKPIVISNAFKILFYDGLDLYGLDLCVELTYRLKHEFPDIGFLFALADEEFNIAYINKVKEKIKELGIDKNFHFMTGQKELWPLFKMVDLSIRPTTTDGDAISIREALYFNCPVLASDAVNRPEGTRLFKSRRVDDLYIQSIKILNNSFSA